ANPLDVILVEDLEHQSEASFQFILPLQEHRRGARNDDFPSFFSQQQLACNQGCFDGLSEAHVVGNEEVYPRQQKSLLQGFKLVGVEMDAGSKWRLKEARVSRSHAVPTKGIQVGRKEGR